MPVTTSATHSVFQIESRRSGQILAELRSPTNAPSLSRTLLTRTEERAQQGSASAAQQPTRSAWASRSRQCTMAVPTHPPEAQRNVAAAVAIEIG